MTALLPLALVVAGSALGQPGAATPSTVLARNIEAGNQVLVLDLPEESDGRAFLLAFLPSGQKWSSHTLIGRAGDHAYDLRRLPGWKGRILQVVTSSSGTPAVIREPTIRDEWDMFMSPEPLLPSTVHMLGAGTSDAGFRGHSLLGYSWDLVLFLIFIMASVAWWLARWTLQKSRATSETASWACSCLLGFVTAWVVMDIRTWVDHFDIVTRTEHHGGNLFLLPEVKRFCDRAADLIGSHTWTREANLGGMFDSYVDYRLAEHPYRPQKRSGVNGQRSDARSADFVIIGQNASASRSPQGSTPGDWAGNLVWRSGGFSLLQTNRPRELPGPGSTEPAPYWTWRSVLVIALHLAVNIWTGWVLLSFWPSDRSRGETLACALLVGMYLETLGVASLLFLGFPLSSAKWLALLLPGVLTGAAWWKRRSLARWVHSSPGSFGAGTPLGMVFSCFSSLGMARRLHWFEWALLLAIAEKVAFAVWQLMRTPVYFVDALSHWSGRGRALFGAVNWSMDPRSPAFLGVGEAKHYPLLTPIWRALTASYNGGWDELLARVDGLAFYLVVIGSVWLAVWRFSKERRLAAAATFVVAAMPLHAWHTAAGYSDVAVEAFAIAGLAAILRREYLLAGVFTAGAAWAKNDGLAIFLPVLLLASVLSLERKPISSQGNGSLRSSWIRAAWFLCGFATLTPWLLFKWWHRLGLSPRQNQMSWHPEAVQDFVNYVLLGPTSSIFWSLCLAALAGTAVALVRDRRGRILLSIVAGSCLLLLFVFSCTDCFEWLANQATIHRSMMQLSPIAVVAASYGLWLKASGRRDKAVSGPEMDMPTAEA
jgi:hypothetical protein